MLDKIVKYEKELDELIEEGENLFNAIQYDCHGDSYIEKIKKTLNLNDNKLEEHLNDLPTFKLEYQSWYSTAQSVIKQLLPNRLIDFESYYEYKKPRKVISFDNYMIKDYLQGVVAKNSYGEIKVNTSAAIPEFIQQLMLVKAAKNSLRSVLYDLSGILQADLFDSEIDTAGSLAKAGYSRAAGALCGVVLEKHLKHVNDLHNLTVKKNPGIADLSQSLKDANVITLPQWRQIQLLADIRNLCSHAKSDEPSKEDIQELVDGTKKILKSVY